MMIKKMQKNQRIKTLVNLKINIKFYIYFSNLYEL